MLNNTNTEVISLIEAVITPNVSSNPSNESFIFSPNNKARADDHSFLGTKNERKYEYIDCDDEKQIQSLFSNDLGNSENKNHGKYLKGSIINETEQEFSKYINNGTLESVQLRVRSPVITMLTARIILNNNKGEISISDILNSDFCKKNKITAITLLLPNQDEKRGIRGRVDENGIRIYEIANGSYNMTLKWRFEEKECNIKVNISDDGSIKFLERNGITVEQLAANNVKIGKQYEAKPLHELLASQLQPSTNVTNVDMAAQEQKKVLV
ncbi:hypothetical protein [Candidatus Mesenet endosymbiont of Agriotes lineatus]|uniref:hypothetical protein n=1 Tax=Candidatus Mesenet endosymbiont of Agriotes lineatus TaxID=3077948 RepID=UPI0030D33404